MSGLRFKRGVARFRRQRNGNPKVMQGFFKTLIRPDREENPRRSEVARAANLLQIGEFQFLQLAYAEWFNEEMPEEVCNRLFMGYMLYDKVPHWARHYARRIMALDREGVLDERDPFYHRYDRDYRSSDPEGVLKFCTSVVIVVAFIGGILLLGHIVADGKGISVLPPYFEKQELAPKKTPLSGS